ncbi:MAG: hypothetical protein GF418_08715, partial [Chitinivibrionales bacterium]|nr:hypothetical protein [Chitinivibrionales bacterium]MBD3395694.1 hypothetical protein [Chitinivibrionales bacterium]
GAHIDIFAGLETWLASLCQFGRPVVWLDFDNTAPHLDRRALTRKNYFRCYSSDREGVRLALDTLHKLGHRSIAFVECGAYGGQDWQRRRKEYVLEETRTRYRDLSVHVIAQHEEFWRHRMDRERCDILDHADAIRRSLARQYPLASESRMQSLLRDCLAQDVPSLAAIAARRDCTAVLAPNQWLAINYYYWFRFAGFEVPSDLSIIGFDNRLPFEAHPVSTVDFKLDYLGYAAAHALLGDVPVNADRQGNIPSLPAVLDRGTLGRPRTRAVTKS